MKLLTRIVLFTIPTLLLAQEPIAAADETNSGARGAAASALGPLTPEQKASQRALRLIEPMTLVSSAFGAGVDQWRNVPREWGQGSEAYAIRFASAEGFTAAHNAVALGFDIAFHLDPRYRA